MISSPKGEIRVELPNVAIPHPPHSDLFKQNLLKADSFIVFSAHFDDAVLSMGSTIAFLLSKGKKVEVVTIFTRGYNATSLQTEILLKLAGFANHEVYFAARAQENADALAILGDCSIRNLDFTDAPWRVDHNASFLYPEAVIGEPLKQDLEVQENIINTIRSLSVANNAIVFSHLGWGNHVDHLLTRNASLAVFPDALLFQDFPYSERYPGEYPYIRDQHLHAVDWYEPFYELKAESIKAYRTQTRSLFRVNPMVLPLERFYLHQV